MKTSFIKELFESHHINRLNSDDPEYKEGKTIEAEFSDLVEVMQKSKFFPLPLVNDLMSLFWDLVGQKITPVAIVNMVPTPTFMCSVKGDGKKETTFAMVLVPTNWHDMLVSDPYMQMGALVFLASKAKDYWNNKFHPSVYNGEEIVERAQFCESQLLHHFSKTREDFKPNEYQIYVMGKYPLGCSSDNDYVGRNYDGVFPPYPLDHDPTNF